MLAVFGLVSFVKHNQQIPLVLYGTVALVLPKKGATRKPLAQ